jgi:hypothetical protein
MSEPVNLLTASLVEIVSFRLQSSEMPFLGLFIQQLWNYICEKVGDTFAEWPLVMIPTAFPSGTSPLGPRDTDTSFHMEVVATLYHKVNTRHFPMKTALGLFPEKKVLHFKGTFVQVIGRKASYHCLPRPACDGVFLARRPVFELCRVPYDGDLGYLGLEVMAGNPNNIENMSFMVMSRGVERKDGRSRTGTSLLIVLKDSSVHKPTLIVTGEEALKIFAPGTHTEHPPIRFMPDYLPARIHRSADYMPVTTSGGTSGLPWSQGTANRLEQKVGVDTGTVGPYATKAMVFGGGIASEGQDDTGSDEGGQKYLGTATETVAQAAVGAREFGNTEIQPRPLTRAGAWEDPAYGNRRAGDWGPLSPVGRTDLEQRLGRAEQLAIVQQIQLAALEERVRTMEREDRLRKEATESSEHQKSNGRTPPLRGGRGR